MAASRPQRTGQWQLGLFLAAILALKIAIARQLGDHPLLSPDAGLDTASYLALARRVMAGDILLGPGLYYLSPLYIYFLAALLFVSDSLVFVRVVQVCLGTAAVALIFVTARRWFGNSAAWIAATLAALTGVLTFYEIVILQSALDSFLSSAALAALAAGLAAAAGTTGSDADGTWVDGRLRRLLVAGVFFGLLTLNRPNAGLAAGGVLIALLAIRRWRGAAAIAIGMALTLGPVAIRNVAVARQFALVSSQGGLNFYIGNRAEATGQYLEVPGVRPNIEGQAEDTRVVAERAVGHRLSDAEVSRYFAGQAFAWMGGHPGAAARLYFRKLALVFNARHQWLDFSYPYYAYDTGSFLWLLFVGPWLLVPLGVAAWCLAPRSDRTAFYVWASFVPAYAASLALFFVAERYRTPLWPPLAVAAGGAVAAAFRDDRWKRALAAALAAAVVTFSPFELPDGRFEERQRLAKVLMNRHDYNGAAAELEHALALRPSDAGTEFALGMAQVSAGRKDEGIDHLRRAIDHGVAIPGARYALANVLLRTGDTAAAVRQLRSFSPEPSDSAESCFQVAMLAIDAGENDVARRYLRRALELKPGWANAEQVLRQLGGA